MNEILDKSFLKKCLLLVKWSVRGRRTYSLWLAPDGRIVQSYRYDNLKVFYTNNPWENDMKFISDLFAGRMNGVQLSEVGNVLLNLFEDGTLPNENR